MTATTKKRRRFFGPERHQKSKMVYTGAIRKETVRGSKGRVNRVAKALVT